MTPAKVFKRPPLGDQPQKTGPVDVDRTPISYTVKGAHEATGLSEWKIRDLIREGRLERRYNGAQVLVLASSLRRYIERELPVEPQVPRDWAFKPKEGA